MSKHELPATLELYGKCGPGHHRGERGRVRAAVVHGAFHPAEEFELARDLFDHELGLLRANTADDAAQWDDWEAVHASCTSRGCGCAPPTIPMKRATSSFISMRPGVVAQRRRPLAAMGSHR